tara:strand:- start:440 stop:1255 length:816 start_codon:yes stop_codon:yes gene_type:complete
VQLNQDFLVNEFIFDNKSFVLFFFTSLFIFILGFFDDKYNFSASFKFLIITFIILSILFFDNDLNIKIIKFSFLNNEFYIHSYSIIFTTFCFLVFLNAFNMFDGINLQSSIYSIIIFLSILFFYFDSLLIKVILISILGYSYLNFKNKVFLGDSGSLLLAFIIGYIFIKLYNFEKINFTDEIVIYMLVPGTDLIRLFFKRLYLKKNPLTPDRFHIHHLLTLKYSHFKSVLILLSLIILPIGMTYFNINSLLIIILFVIFYSILIKIVLLKN